MNTLFYDPTQLSSFSTPGKLKAAVNGKKQNKMLSRTGFYYRIHKHYINLFRRDMKRGGGKSVCCDGYKQSLGT
jgi:hypothetical protein